MVSERMKYRNFSKVRQIHCNSNVRSAGERQKKSHGLDGDVVLELNSRSVYYDSER